MPFNTTTPTYPLSFPVFGGLPRCGTLLLNNASGSSTTTAFNSFTPGTNGTRVTEIRCSSGPTTAPGGSYIVEIIVNDGSNDYIFDRFVLTNTADTQQGILQPVNLILPSTYTLKAIVRTTLTSGATLNLIAMGNDMQVGP